MWRCLPLTNTVHFPTPEEITGGGGRGVGRGMKEVDLGHNVIFYLRQNVNSTEHLILKFS
jgi:hypothetical protein